MINPTMKTGTAPRLITLPDGHSVTVAYRDPSNERLLHIERLINTDDLYGTVTVHGTLYKRSWKELETHLMFVFSVDTVSVVRTTLVY